MFVNTLFRLFYLSVANLNFRYLYVIDLIVVTYFIFITYSNNYFNSVHTLIL